MPSAGSIRMLVRLPDRVDRLRFDPTTRQGARFALPILRSASLAKPVDEVLAPCASRAPRDAPVPDNRVEKAVACDVRADAHLEALNDGRFRTIGDDPQFSVTGAG